MLEKLTLIFGTLVHTNINQVYVAIYNNTITIIDATTGNHKSKEYINRYMFDMRQSFIFLDSPFSIENLLQTATSHSDYFKIDIVIVDAIKNGELGIKETEKLINEAINSSLTFEV